MKLSIILCTYNRDKYIYDVLKSIAANDLSHSLYEIVLVNNNSTDNTEAICNQFHQDYPAVVFRYFIEMNQGLSFARNRGIEESTGDIMVCMDDDETVNTDFLQSIYNFFRDYPEAGISAGPVIPVYEKEKPKWFSPLIEHLMTASYDKGDKIKLLGKKDYPGMGHACFRKELFLKYGALDTNLGRKGKSLMGAEDKDFFLRLMNGGEKCFYLPSACIYHHIPDSKLTVEYFKNLTYAIGKSEKIRTLNVSKAAYLKRLLAECIKWVASILLCIGYTLTLSPQKGWKLIQFRWNVSKGLISK